MARLFIGIFLIICIQPDLLGQKMPRTPNRTDANGMKQGAWTILYDSAWKIIENKKAAEFYRQITYSDNLPTGVVKDYYRNGNVQWEGMLLADQPEDIIDGTCFYYRPDGSLQFEAVYDNGNALGQLEYENNLPKVSSWNDVYAFGDVYWNREQFEEAARCYQMALPIAEKEEGQESGYATYSMISLSVK